MEFMNLPPQCASEQQLDEINQWDSGFNLTDESEHKPVNSVALEDLEFFLGEEFVSHINGFMDKTSAELRIIARGLEERDYAKVREAAHPLKGASAQYGAEIISAIAVRMEILACAENHEYLCTLNELLRSRWSEAAAELAEIIK